MIKGAGRKVSDVPQDNSIASAAFQGIELAPPTPVDELDRKYFQRFALATCEAATAQGSTCRFQAGIFEDAADNFPCSPITNSALRLGVSHSEFRLGAENLVRSRVQETVWRSRGLDRCTNEVDSSVSPEPRTARILVHESSARRPSNRPYAALTEFLATTLRVETTKRTLACF